MDLNTTYDTYSDCLDANLLTAATDDLATCAVDQTTHVINQGALIAGYSLLGLGGLAFNFAIMGRFLILTTDSLLEGLGGNLNRVMSPGNPEFK
jgi:hypothetical protein